MNPVEDGHNPLRAPVVRLFGISKSFERGSGRDGVLDQVSLDLVRGETTSLVGASGSGKTTLLGLIAGLLLPDSGSVEFDGVEMSSLHESARARLRSRRLGVVLQSGNLIPFLTASENVQMAIKLGGCPQKPAAGARRLLSELGVLHRASHLPRHLSGGEAQRVALAMALAHEPDVLLADEMTGELDSSTADKVMDLVFRESSERRLTVLFVTHNAALASRAQNRAVLTAGRVHPA